MKEFFNQVLFHLASRDITVFHMIWVGLFAITWLIVFRIFTNKGMRQFYENNGIGKRQQGKLRAILLLLMLLTSTIMLAWLLDFDLDLFTYQDKTLRLSHILKGLCIWQVARLTDWLITNILIHKYYALSEGLNPESEDGKSLLEGEKRAASTVRYIVYVFALLLSLRSFDLDYTLWTSTVNKIPLQFRLSNILNAALILLFARLFISVVIHIVLKSIYRTRGITTGSRFAINQLLKYVVYVFAIFWALDSLGIDITLFLGGAAALLVGVGLGLQQTFNDFISGIVILFERSISVGDVINVGGVVGRVEKIGMRASTIETRENKDTIVPNSKLVNDLVDNWSHFDPTVRFDVSVGVAYGSDTALVKKLLLQAADEVPRVLSFPKPFVRFNEFGDSSLNFNLYFFTNDNLYYEDIQSDLRFEIDRLFRENDITIPFPQRDIWIKKES